MERVLLTRSIMPCAIRSKLAGCGCLVPHTRFGCGRCSLGGISRLRPALRDATRSWSAPQSLMTMPWKPHSSRSTSVSSQWSCAACTPLMQLYAQHDGHGWGFSTMCSNAGIDFAQCTLGDVGADAQTVGFLIVGGEMLKRSAHALGLHAGDDADGFMTRQIRIFRPVFEAAASERVALDVHARAEDYGDLLLNALFGHGFANLVDEFRIPGAGQTSRRREAGGRHAVVQVDFAGGGRIGLAQAVGAVGDHVAGNALVLQRPADARRRRRKSGMPSLQASGH